MQNFSDRLATAITRSKKRKGALADHCGVALSTVSRWLSGSTPDFATIPRIADFLGVDAKWLLSGGSDFPETKVQEEPAHYPKPAAPSLQESAARIALALERIAAALENKPER